MPMTTNQFQAFLVPGLRDIIGEAYLQPTRVYPQYLNVLTSKRAFEDDINLALLNQSQAKAELEPVIFQDPLEGNTTRYTMTAYALGISISHEMMEDNLYNALNDLPALLGRSQALTENRQAASVLNNGFATNGADGVPLFDNSHPLLRGGTSDNLLTAATISPASVQDMLINLEQQVDQAGEPIIFESVFLVAPRELIYRAREVLESQLRALESSNTKNVIGSIDLVIDPWLSSATAWFGITNKAMHKLKFYWRERMTIDNWPDQPVWGWRFATYMRLATGFSEWMGTVGNQGA